MLTKIPWPAALIAAVCLLVPATGRAEEEKPGDDGKAPAEKPDHPLCKDKTGMPWVLPFSAAKAKAEKEGRILMIKPVAFGTSPDGGW